ncbi:MAG: hypothetical protein KIT46_03620 [Anaerolineales bacterium]|nr:hypothetical protein [Anaerolineales bacterium]MCW5855114.1 hypothetical protein [Anaerolineales bacterium]
MRKLNGRFAERLAIDEEKIFEVSFATQADSLKIFNLCQDNLWLILEEKLFLNFDSSKFVVRQLAARILTMSQAAMRLALFGYTQEAMSIARVVEEAIQVSFYLSFHEKDVPNYLAGKLKVSQILKLNRKLNVLGLGDAGQELWGYLSNFAHAKPETIFQLAQEEAGNFALHLLYSSQEGIGNLCAQLNINFFKFYCWYRLLFRDLAAVPEEVEKNDVKLFLSTSSSEVFPDEMTQLLPKFYSLLYPLSSAQEAKDL